MTAKTASAAKPAFDFDMFKAFNQFKAPGFDMKAFGMQGFDFEAMMASQRKNMEAAAAANQKAFEGMSKIMTRQAEMAREAAESGMKAMSDMVAAQPEERMTKQADFAKSSYESMLANGKETYEMASKVADETMTLVSARAAAAMDETKAAFAQK